MTTSSPARSSTGGLVVVRTVSIFALTRSRCPTPQVRCRQGSLRRTTLSPVSIALPSSVEFPASVAGRDCDDDEQHPGTKSQNDTIRQIVLFHTAPLWTVLASLRLARRYTKKPALGGACK